MQDNTVNALISDNDEVRVPVSRTQLLDVVLWVIENILAEAAGALSTASHDVWVLS